MKNLVVLRGGMGSKERRNADEALRTIPESEERLILATGRYIGEGFDDSRLDTLFLAMPIAWKGTVVQYVGRLQRQHAGKSEVIVYDYVDRQVPMLARMFAKRMRIYTALGYRVDRAVASTAGGGSPSAEASDATRPLDFEHPASR